MRRTYVGYDLGNTETITDVVTLEEGRLSTRTVFDNMTMPGTDIPGQAMPTIFAFDEDGKVVFSNVISADCEYVHNITSNFKKRPSTLLLPSKRTEFEQLGLLKNTSEWLDKSIWEEGNGDEMLQFKKAVITFTDAIFSDINYANRLISCAYNSDEIVFCVGYPTHWSELDVAIYELVLKSSILGVGIYYGIKSQLIIKCEAEAILYYLQDTEAKQIPKDMCVLIIDAGASTVEVATISHKVDFYAGTDYLGARNIDFMIRDWYLEKIKQQPEMWSMYQTLAKANPKIPNALTLSCRNAKEQLYSFTGISSQSVINFGWFPGIRLTEKDLDKVIDETPIAKILKESINLNDHECYLMGDKSWKTLFKEFLTEKKAEMTKQVIDVSRIVLTGGASKMPFIKNIVLEVFNEIPADLIIYDMDPSRTVSKGLALAAVHSIRPH